jgi:hypothetical protein
VVVAVQALDQSWSLQMNMSLLSSDSVFERKSSRVAKEDRRPVSPVGLRPVGWFLMIQLSIAAVYLEVEVLRRWVLQLGCF